MSGEVDWSKLAEMSDKSLSDDLSDPVKPATPAPSAASKFLKKKPAAAPAASKTSTQKPKVSSSTPARFVFHFLSPLSFSYRVTDKSTNRRPPPDDKK